MIEMYKVSALLISGLLLIALGFSVYHMEGFQAGQPGIRCGVDLPGCPNGLECMNGICSSSIPPALLANQLQVYP